MIAQESVNNLSGNNASQNLPQAIAIKFIVEEQAISTHNINQAVFFPADVQELLQSHRKYRQNPAPEGKFDKISTPF